MNIKTKAAILLLFLSLCFFLTAEMSSEGFEQIKGDPGSIWPFWIQRNSDKEYLSKQKMCEQIHGCIECKRQADCPLDEFCSTLTYKQIKPVTVIHDDSEKSCVVPVGSKCKDVFTYKENGSSLDVYYAEYNDCKMFYVFLMILFLVMFLVIIAMIFTPLLQCGQTILDSIKGVFASNTSHTSTHSLIKNPV